VAGEQARALPGERQDDAVEQVGSDPRPFRAAVGGLPEPESGGEQGRGGRGVQDQVADAADVQALAHPRPFLPLVCRLEHGPLVRHVEGLAVRGEDKSAAGGVQGKAAPALLPGHAAVGGEEHAAVGGGPDPVRRARNGDQGADVLGSEDRSGKAGRGGDPGGAAVGALVDAVGVRPGVDRLGDAAGHCDRHDPDARGAEPLAGRGPGGTGVGALEHAVASAGIDDVRVVRIDRERKDRPAVRAERGPDADPGRGRESERQQADQRDSRDVQATERFQGGLPGIQPSVNYALVAYNMP
jgi:hypothetical protein